MPTDLYLVRHAESCSNLTAGKNTTYRLRHNGILQRFITRIVPHISNEPKNTSITKLTLDTETQTNIYRPSTMKNIDLR